MTRAEKFYDAVMRLPIIAFDLFFLGREASGIQGIVANHPYFGGDWPFLMTLAARTSIVTIFSDSPHGLGRRHTCQSVP